MSSGTYVRTYKKYEMEIFLCNIFSEEEKVTSVRELSVLLVVFYFLQLIMIFLCSFTSKKCISDNHSKEI